MGRSSSLIPRLRTLRQEGPGSDPRASVSDYGSQAPIPEGDIRGTTDSFGFVNNGLCFPGGRLSQDQDWDTQCKTFLVGLGRILDDSGKPERLQQVSVWTCPSPQRRRLFVQLENGISNAQQAQLIKKFTGGYLECYLVLIRVPYSCRNVL